MHSTHAPWETVIGLEVHVQLATNSKIFSGASTQFGAAPNTQACAIDLGLPGVLPVLNEEVVRMAILFGLAINANIAQQSIFARKNYFYPDLPKGYQISQYEHPIVSGGTLDITTEHGTKTIHLTRAHLEEDAGKSLHGHLNKQTGIDLNRAGMPLLEIVSEPELANAAEAIAYLKALHAIVTYLNISNGNMAEGSMRCDINLSVKPKGNFELGTRTEIKNVNSFRFVEKAIEYETERQINLLKQGKTIQQETRLFDTEKNETRPMRSKEEANDYRYFPDPDLLPVVIRQDFIDDIRQSLPELPKAKFDRFVEQYHLSVYDAAILTDSKELANYFEEVVAHTDNTNKDNTKLCCNWVTTELIGTLNKQSLSIKQCPIDSRNFGKLITRIQDQTISSKIAKQVFERLWQQNEDPDNIIKREGLKQMTDSSTIEKLVDTILSQNSKQVEQYQQADAKKQKKLIGFFVGAIMKNSQGKANPQQVNDLLIKKLQPK